MADTTIIHKEDLKMAKVINEHGVEIDMDAAVELMDDSIRESICGEEDGRK